MLLERLLPIQTHFSDIHGKKFHFLSCKDLCANISLSKVCILLKVIWIVFIVIHTFKDFCEFTVFHAFYEFIDFRDFIDLDDSDDFCLFP